MPDSSTPSDFGWYCVRSRPKAEHIAARSLQQFANLDEVFCPRIRFEKATRRGRVWFVEALFPGYLFARFSLGNDLRAVNAAPSVAGVLRFADFVPQIHESYLDELRAEFPEEENAIRVLRPEIVPGDEVMVIEGAMKGLKTVVTRLVSGGDRVAVLLDWLGQEREAEVSLRSVMRPGNIREEVG
ncbi:MAG TPA: transcription termination/antitermination NusG family protein [Bacteroidia bacterium]|nr:transcription termination/antitermination NusG family protein [Bacteroidia bacterium]